MKIDHMGYLMNHLDQPVVVIVGGGPVGLATAIELGTRKIHCILLERNIRDSWSPRAKTTHTRTRGLLSRWGVAKDIAKAYTLGIAYQSNLHFVHIGQATCRERV